MRSLKQSMTSSRKRLTSGSLADMRFIPLVRRTVVARSVFLTHGSEASVSRF